MTCALCKEPIKKGEAWTECHCHEGPEHQTCYDAETEKQRQLRIAKEVVKEVGERFGDALRNLKDK